MLSKSFQEVYNIFKMNFYKSMCENSKELTMQEAFSLDIIYMLGNPTILDYATYMGISQPNATYKINQMIDKGYLVKEVCKNDKRAFRLQVTQKFIDCYRDNDRFIKKTLDDIEQRFDEKEVELLKKMLEDIKKQML
ncbi:MAG: MarR family transcriptional regulator [Erysipelotrichales bacterium]|nr:MarR family transcriptional regulator [Erysipelotrichales bacterium]